MDLKKNQRVNFLPFEFKFTELRLCISVLPAMLLSVVLFAQSAIRESVARNSSVDPVLVTGGICFEHDIIFNTRMPRPPRANF